MATPPIYVFNGDADGICALQQLRLSEPGGAETTEPLLITGVKRHTRLVADVPPQLAAGARITVLDVSFRDNRDAVERLLDAGARVRYFDHHDPGDLLYDPGLDLHIDTAPTTCTSLIVNRSLRGLQLAWAVVGAFGDNLAESAREAAESLALSMAELENLRELGELLNYNGYGESPADLFFHPADLYRAIAPFTDPLEAAHGLQHVALLREGLAADLALAEQHAPVLETASAVAHILPDASWARRIQGVLANRMATADPERAGVVGAPVSGGRLRISIRAPLSQPQGASELAQAFGGGGRAGAAGINGLAPAELDGFLAAFRKAYGA